MFVLPYCLNKPSSSLFSPLSETFGEKLRPYRSRGSNATKIKNILFISMKFSSLVAVLALLAVAQAQSFSSNDCGYGYYCDSAQNCYSCCECNYYQNAIEGYCPSVHGLHFSGFYLRSSWWPSRRVNAIVTYVIIALVVSILTCVGIIVDCCGGVAACCASCGCGAKPAPATPVSI